MDLGLKDKVALITGSSRGIGKAIAKTLHQEGCQVMINGRTSETVNTIVDDLKERVSGVIGDVSNEKAAKTCIKETINTFGALDILVCNVGQSSSVPPGTENQEEFSRILQHNLLSTTNMVMALLSVFHLYAVFR
jgi:3-oxoacyl-[acyl-carrier protein] reductase